ncbi:MAG: hypothetical protein P1V36_10055 [Planctomycetota bacterium]|nr:hypothetical protein [Planctomycetota bacterium]
MRLIPLLLASLILVLLAAVPALAGEATTAAGHRVRWDAGLERVGQRVVAVLPEVRAQVEEALGFPFPGGAAEIVVVRGHARIREETGAGIPDWAAGVCQGHRSLIVLRADRVDQSPLNPMVSTLRHEWVHLAWSRRAGLRARTLPRWVEEGLAEEIGGGVSVEAGAQLDFAARFGWLLDFEAITTDWPREAARASLAYKQGRSFVRFFRQDRGPAVFRELLADLADGKGIDPNRKPDTQFDQVVFARTGSPLNYWTAVWKTDVEEKADPWFHLLWRDFTGTIFIAISLVGLFAFYFMHRRRQRQIAELPDHPLVG